MHVWGLRPRQVLRHLAVSMPQVLPSASVNSVGTRFLWIFEAQYPTCMYPYQRFACAITGAHAWCRATVVCYSFSV